MKDRPDIESVRHVDDCGTWTDLEHGWCPYCHPWESDIQPYGTGYYCASCCCGFV